MNVCREISGLDPCERAYFPFSFCGWFPYLQRQNCSLGSQQTPCCLTGGGDGRDRMLPLHEVGNWAVSTSVLFQTLFLEIHKDWNVSISWSQKSVVWLTDEKFWGHQLSRTPKAHVKIFVYLRFIGFISGVSWKRELYVQLLGRISMTAAPWKSNHPVVERHQPIPKLWRTLDAGLTSLFWLRTSLESSFPRTMLNSQPAENLILYRVREDKAAGRY